MQFSGVKMVAIQDLGLSQIYLSQSKLNAIQEWFDPADMSGFAPLPVHDFGNGRYTLTDGHSRCYTAYRAGITRLPVIYDTDEIVAGEAGRRLYQLCIAWCERSGIRSIGDLEGRFLPPEQYQRLWIERCDRGYQLLIQTTEQQRKALEVMFPGLYLYGASEDGKIFYYEDAAGALYVYESGVLRAEKGVSRR